MVSPPYEAVMVSVPEKGFGAKDATPLELRGAEPRTVVPTRKVTVPVGAGPAVPTTVATRRTPGAVPPVLDSPSAVAVEMVPTTWVMAREVAGASLPSPEYETVMEWLPTARPELPRLALPVASRVAFPKAVPSAAKMTVPVGTPPLPETLAEKVTGESTTEGLALEVTAAVAVAMSTCRDNGTETAPVVFVSPE
jgi:hypothetical protein